MICQFSRTPSLSKNSTLAAPEDGKTSPLALSPGNVPIVHPPRDEIGSALVFIKRHGRAFEQLHHQLTPAGHPISHGDPIPPTNIPQGYPIPALESIVPNLVSMLVRRFPAMDPDTIHAEVMAVIGTFGYEGVSTDTNSPSPVSSASTTDPLSQIAEAERL